MRRLDLAAKRVISRALSSPLNLAATLAVAFVVVAAALALFTWASARWRMRERMSSSCQNKCNKCNRCRRKGKKCRKKCNACSSCRDNDRRTKKPKRDRSNQNISYSGRQLLSTGGGGGGWRDANLTVYGNKHEHSVDVALKPYKADPENDIAAVHKKDFEAYKDTTLEIQVGNKKPFKVRIVDLCADKDCSDKVCCTRNANRNGAGFLIDLHARTADRHGIPSSVTAAKFRVVG